MYQFKCTSYETQVKKFDIKFDISRGGNKQKIAGCFIQITYVFRKRIRKRMKNNSNITKTKKNVKENLIKRR